MRTFFISSAIAVVFLTTTAAGIYSGVMTKQTDGTYVVNTTTLSSAEGYRGKTPLEVHIKNNKIVKIVPLKNHETPKYFAMVKKTLLPKYAGMKTSKVEKTKIDGVTGATYSSDAVIANVKAAVNYYKKNRN